MFMLLIVLFVLSLLTSECQVHAAASLDSVVNDQSSESPVVSAVRLLLAHTCWPRNDDTPPSGPDNSVVAVAKTTRASFAALPALGAPMATDSAAALGPGAAEISAAPMSAASAATVFEAASVASTKVA